MECKINKVLFECDNKGNSFISLREVSWGARPHKLELRKWSRNNSGEEVPLKGFSFNSEEGIDELTLELVKAGFGNKSEIINCLDDRKEEKEIQVYDPKTCLL